MHCLLCGRGLFEYTLVHGYEYGCVFNKNVHNLVTTDNTFIDARFNYETCQL